MREISLSKRLFEETKSAHEQVESMPFILALRNQKLSRQAYIQYLIDLKGIYQVLEEEMKHHLDHPQIKSLYEEKLNRTKHLEADLNAFAPDKMEPTQAAQDYMLHLKNISKSSPLLLLAHAYVRYLGDLSGGRMMKKFIQELFPGGHTSFYNFDELLGKEATGARFVDYKNEWKKRLDAMDLNENQKRALIEEAKSFEYARKMFGTYVS
ncbi:MAG: biliverdin-producing heme oxygenase [Parachlamydiaceae bacterium]|nr:MAG: biliverdin-producing heme oxygenase [Parachlamydiaceae bacterium]